MPSELQISVEAPIAPVSHCSPEARLPRRATSHPIADAVGSISSLKLDCTQAALKKRFSCGNQSRVELAPRRTVTSWRDDLPAALYHLVAAGVVITAQPFVSTSIRTNKLSPPAIPPGG